MIFNYPEPYVGPCDSAYFDIVIQNSGTAPLVIDGYHFTDELFPIEDNRWNVIDTLPINIPPLSNDTIQVQFIPWRYTNFEYWYGIRENTLVLDNNDPDNDSVSVALSIPVVLNGSGYTLNNINWTPWVNNTPEHPTVDFGTVSIGDSLDTTIVLTSYGIEGLEVDGVLPAEIPFSLVADDGEMNLFESIDIEITFTPVEFGDFTDTITIESNAQMYYPPFIVDLPGPAMGTPEPKFIIKGKGFNCYAQTFISLSGIVNSYLSYLILDSDYSEYLFDVDFNGTINIFDFLLAIDINEGWIDLDCAD